MQRYDVAVFVVTTSVQYVPLLLLHHGLWKQGWKIWFFKVLVFYGLF